MASDNPIVEETQSIDWKKFLLSFNGRVSRQQYNLYFLFPYVLVYLALNVVDQVTGLYDATTQTGLFSGVFSILSLWPMLTLTTKRFHDREVTGWRQAIYFIALIVGGMLAAGGMVTLSMMMISVGFLIVVASLIAFIIEICFLKGTEGPNKYGEDPLKKLS